MNRTEHLLTIFAEECVEVAQRCTKALRFGLTEIEPAKGQTLNNAQRIIQEFNDLLGVIEMLQEAEPEDFPTNFVSRAMIDAKKIKVEKFLKYSKKIGTLKKN